jgi:lipopolysaccharide export system permease protein
MKKIDKLILSSFLGPFILTFLVVVFILLMQHMLKYFDDIIGKDLGWGVLSTLLFYFAVFMTPVALPLAVLLSSLITFGNLGEHFELTAIKSLGVSLTRALMPIFMVVILITFLAFLANNYLVPKAALEAYSLLYDIKQKKPSLDLKEGAFYGAIPDVNIKVNKKYPDGVALKGVVIYDHRGRTGNKEVTVADSGRMYTIMNSKYLKLELFDGYNYGEGGGADQDIIGQPRNRDTFSKTKFDKTYVIFDLSAFSLGRTDKKWFQGNRIMRNLAELNYDMDSVDNAILYSKLTAFRGVVDIATPVAKSLKLVLPAELERAKQQQQKDPILSPDISVVNQSRDSTKSSARPIETDSAKVSRDTQKAKTAPDNTRAKVSADSSKAKPVVKSRRKRRTETVNPESRSSIRRRTALANKNTKQLASTPEVKPVVVKPKKVNIDSLLNVGPTRDEVTNALSITRTVKDQLSGAVETMKSQRYEFHVFQIQWHKILASSFACMVMFLIGAPLGAIIKRGGLGIPVLVSILFFIFFYVMTITGEKWAKQEFLSVPIGIWGPDFILLVFGFVFLRQARVDARLFESDFYQVVMEKIKSRFRKPQTNQ